MNKIIAFLKGKKTYLVIIVGIIINGLYAMGYIPQQYIPAIDATLGLLGLGALRLGMANK